MPDNWEIGDILKFIFVGFVILSWIGGSVVRMFLRGEEQKRRVPGPERPIPARQAAAPAGRQQQRPADMGSFLEELRRRSDEQEREFQRQALDEEEDEEDFEEQPLFWEPVAAERARTPRRPLRGFAHPEADVEVEEVRRTPSAAAVVKLSAEARVTDPAVSNLYAAPAHFSLPSWLSVSDITQAKHLGTILGVTPQKAILLTEIIGPPLAMRRRPGGRHSGPV